MNDTVVAVLMPMCAGKYDTVVNFISKPFKNTTPCLCSYKQRLFISYSGINYLGKKVFI